MALYELKSAIKKVDAKRRPFAFYKGKKLDQIFLGPAPNKEQNLDMVKLCGEVKLIFKGLCYDDGANLILATKVVPAATWENMVVKALRDQKCPRPFILRQLTKDEAKELGPTEGGLDEENLPTDGAEDATAAPELTPSPAGDGGQRFQQRFAALQPGLIQALREQRGDPGKLRAVIGLAQEKAKEGNFASALASLYMLEKLLGTSPAAPIEKPADGADPMAAFKARFAALVPKLKQAIADGRAGMEEHRLLASQASVLANKKDFAGAIGLLDLIDRWLTTSTGQPVPAGATDAETPGTAGVEAADEADHAALLPIWQQARDVVNGQLSKLQAKLRATADPDFAVVADVGLNGVTKRLQVGLQVALMDFDGTRGEDREKARGKVRAAIANFRQFLETNKMVAAIESNPFDVAVTLTATLGRALNTLSKSVAR